MAPQATIAIRQDATVEAVVADLTRMNLRPGGVGQINILAANYAVAQEFAQKLRGRGYGGYAFHYAGDLVSGLSSLKAYTGSGGANAAMGARAFTAGPQVFGSVSTLAPHEAAHTVQQGGAPGGKSL